MLACCCLKCLVMQAKSLNGVFIYLFFKLFNFKKNDVTSCLFTGERG